MFQQITLTTAQSLDRSIIGKSFNKAMISVEGADIRIRTDGVNPTTTIGVKIPSGSVITLSSYNEIKGARFIAISGTALLNVNFS